MNKVYITFLLTFFLLVVKSQTVMNRDVIIEKAVSEVSVANMKSLVEDLVGFHNRNNLSSKTDPVKGIGAAAEYLYNKASSYIPESSGRLSVEKVYYNVDRSKISRDFTRDITLCNIIATVKGSNTTDDRIITLLAHYDNRNGRANDSIGYAPGANDDGSGIACLMEITRIISKIDIPVTVKLMFLSGEEHGLFGAQHMSDVAKAEGWNIIAVLNNDMIGNSNASETNTQTNTVLRVFSENIPAVETPEQARVRVYNSSENDSPSRQLARYIKETGERYVDNMTVKLIYRNDRFGRGGDHTPFSKNGFTGVRLCEIHENYDRTHQDIFEKNGIKYGDEIWAVDFEYVRKNTGVNLSTTLNMAFAPSVPENTRIITSGLTNFSEIKWDVPKQGKAPHAYYLLIRETDQPVWEKKILVYGTSMRVPYSKDNYFFGVQSIDETGHESLPVFAEGARR